MTAARTFIRSLGVIAMAAVSFACAGDGGSGSASGPSPSPGVSLTGSWVGTASDSTGPGQMMWQVSQSGGSFNGTMTVTDTATRQSGRGSVSGTISGSAIRFTIAIPAGGFDAPNASCTAGATGEGQLAGTAITATYEGSSSCGGTIASGQMTLNKQ